MTLGRFTFILLSLCLCGTSYASNMSFLNYSPVSYFDDTDSKLMYANVESALSHVADGKKSNWKNAKTGAWGYAIPSQTRVQNGTTCRTLKVFNEAHQVTGMSSYTACKIQGVWKFQ